jgi:hypothetical protein
MAGRPDSSERKQPLVNESDKRRLGEFNGSTVQPFNRSTTGGNTFKSLSRSIALLEASTGRSNRSNRSTAALGSKRLTGGTGQI